jgi:hypothetical protein
MLTQETDVQHLYSWAKVWPSPLLLPTLQHDCKNTTIHDVSRLTTRRASTAKTLNSDCRHYRLGKLVAAGTTTSEALDFCTKTIPLVKIMRTSD